MQLIVENCRNIHRAEIAIEPCKLNLKYAPNGVGKTSISKAIKYAFARDSVAGSDLIPFEMQQAGVTDTSHLVVSGLDDFACLKVFDDEYVTSVVFQKSQVFTRGYEVFVKTSEFVRLERQVSGQLASLARIAQSGDVIALKAALDSFTSNMCGGSGLDRAGRLRSTSPVVKALATGNLWENVPQELLPFSPIVSSTEFKNWATWHSKGAGFASYLGGKCPYCGQDATPAHQSIQIVDAEFPSAKVGNIEKSISAIGAVRDYLSNDCLAQAQKIIGSSEPLTDQKKNYLAKMASDAIEMSKAIDNLQSVSSVFELKEADDLANRLKACQLDMSLLSSFDSEACRSISNTIEREVSEAIQGIGKLTGLVNQLKQKLAQTLAGEESAVNRFLSSAGYPYSVRISADGDGQCSVRLIHKSGWSVTETETTLSYGEKNAFSLVFFAYECVNNGADLIILDDPISSFDGVKRFALLDMLFLEGQSGGPTLKNKTVLLFTHDYGVLYDIECAYKPRFQPTAQSTLLSSTNGLVVEKAITPVDMRWVVDLYRELAVQSGSMLVKLVYARRLLELNGDRGCAFDVVSSLFHHRAEPSRDEVPLTSREVDEGTRQLVSIIQCALDYDELVATLDSPSEMLAAFESAECNLEKLQLARLATDSELGDMTLKAFLHESVHAGNAYQYQLDPREYEVVPDYIVEKCHDELVARCNGHSLNT